MVRFFVFCEEWCLTIADRHCPRAAVFARRYARVIKYVAAGGTAAVVDLGLLYALTDIAGWHYIVSTTVAFLAAFGVSFTLQKFWTFGNQDMDRVHIQLALYLTIAVVNLFVNAGLMYFFVETAGIWYFLAQIITGAIMACYGFLLYRYIIFRNRPHEDTHRNTEG